MRGSTGPEGAAPLDLRSLGEVDEPEVIRAALRRFRRRVLVRGVAILAVVAVLVGLRVAGPWRPTIAQRIERAQGEQVGGTWRVGRATVVLVRAADLGEDTGLHLLVLDPTAGAFDDYTIGFSPRASDFASRGDGRAVEQWYRIRVPPGGAVVATLWFIPMCRATAEHGCESRSVRAGTFTIDFAARDVPAWVWR